jgi:hypothetical protein
MLRRTAPARINVPEEGITSIIRMRIIGELETKVAVTSNETRCVFGY